MLLMTFETKPWAETYEEREARARRATEERIAMWTGRWELRGEIASDQCKSVIGVDKRFLMSRKG